MQREPALTWRNVQHSEPVEAIIRKRIEAVEKLCPNAVGLRITLNAPQKPRHAARGFDVRLFLDAPGPNLEVARTVRHGVAADDIVRAVNATFTALEMRIKETRRIIIWQPAQANRIWHRMEQQACRDQAKAAHLHRKPGDPQNGHPHEKPEGKVRVG